jgi:hypothetical protein
MKNIIDNNLSKIGGGNKFFNNIDNSFKLTKNLDLIQSIFNKMNNNKNFNLILTGGFGDWVLLNIKKGKLKVPGNLILVNGSLRGKNNKLNKITSGKKVEIIYKKDENISNKKFILFDDSYYSGSTEKSIKTFLKKYNSNIIKTYVLYDGNDKKDINRESLYRYYDYNKGGLIKIKKLLEYLYDLNLNIPLDIIEKGIYNNKIRTIRQINIEINKILLKFNLPPIDINSINKKDEMKYEKISKY